MTQNPDTSETLAQGLSTLLSSFTLGEEMEMQRSEESTTGCEEPCKEFGLYKQWSLFESIVDESIDLSLCCRIGSTIRAKSRVNISMHTGTCSSNLSIKQETYMKALR